ncbi:MAG: type VI secretion system tip protein TssI/VgrG [Proteiniphilum sp.]|uniref:type VI secretion system tip protein TssI/VgrG n=1 Tax=Proteiniphilum sp. TaxID=1926877 RepID=UPI002B1E9110|nr:type VI secretion system tip protein TssI/VgrG [Proteiniphilum sp.]MEA5115852.1 type VI secretion system tip protein TssI/VgrG [Geobacteraceae bacterium]MEA5130166.1 type VI secretion system tip protein TssI/VgrG [Proteiniphilum sp.]
MLTVVGGVGAILNDESGDRYFHGIIRKFKHAGTSERLQIYEAQMVPSLWLLSLEEKCRIFQDKPLKEIITTLLDERDIASDMYEFRLARDDIFIKFSIQYQETNLHYLSRLLEHEGIFYFFEHFKDKHVLVFCDTDAFYQNITGRPAIPFKTNGLVAQEENIYSFVISERLRPGKLLQKNFNFKTPSVDLTTTQETEIETDYEVYEYPGPYGETAKGDTMSQIRLEEILALARRGYGDSTCPRLQPGAVFTLKDHLHDDFNAEYFVYAAAHEGEQPQILQEHGSGGSAHYSNSFSVIPANVTFRPERISCKPMVPGLLSAIVTGPKGEEIWPDKYGRVNVQFHFDREGKRDEKSSCWLRVMQFWNGPTWGSQFIPRVGDEVLVSFINGDMDYPVVMGSAVNAAKMPNYSLPANKTQSGIKTRSYPKGGPDNYNELRFDDKKGAEEIYMQGEKDWNILIKNNKGQTIGGSSSTTVAGASSETAKTITLTAEMEIKLVCGDSTISLGPSGINIKGDTIHMNE